MPNNTSNQLEMMNSLIDAEKSYLENLQIIDSVHISTYIIWSLFNRNYELETIPTLDETIGVCCTRF